MLALDNNAATKRRTAFVARHGQAVEAALARALNKLAVSDAHADETDTNVVVKLLGEELIKAIGDALRVNASLTSLDLMFNGIGDEAKAALREAVKGRDGFSLSV